MQKEITEKSLLLDEKGSIMNPGWSRHMLYDYNRDDVSLKPFSLKEWDYYQLQHGEWFFQIVIANISYVTNFTIMAFNTETHEVRKVDYKRPFVKKSPKMPVNPEDPNVINITTKDFALSFKTEEHVRVLRFLANDSVYNRIEAEIRIPIRPDEDKMVIATPFKDRAHFFLNYKENLFGVRGFVKFGDWNIQFDESKDTGVYDWGRGSWPFDTSWYWGTASHILEDGTRFGLNVGWGFGDLSYATEDMYFVNGKAHKINALYVEQNNANFMDKWHMRADDGSLDLSITPYFNNYIESKAAIMHTYQNQIHAKINGIVTAEDGSKIELNDVPYFFEVTNNRW
jgi:hypothetical protein